MSNNKYQNAMLRKEEAGRKAEIVNRRSDSIKYEIVDNNIIILSGSYANRGIRELWYIGDAERDYIIEKLWSLGDEKINNIIKSMTCE